jgi:hypothetical protein
LVAVEEATVTKSGVADKLKGRRLEMVDAQGQIRAALNGGDDNGYLGITNKAGEVIAHPLADEYGNGVTGARNRKGEGQTLQLG